MHPPLLLQDRPQSLKAFEEAKEVIPGGVNSPVRSFAAMEMPPLVVKEGRGCEIVDLDGNRYLDFCNSWGALIHGHAHPALVEAAVQQVRKGSTFGITTAIEGKMAQKMVDAVPGLEKIRFVSSGTEATMSALRLARGYTGREAILKFSGCYHGHADLLLVQAGSGVAALNSTSTSKGVPPSVIKNTLVLPFNDVEKCRQLFRHLGESLAAVIVEPIPANMGVVPPERGFLEMLREESRQSGTVLIFDEVITGFRVGPAGASDLLGIVPDLMTFGKIIGGGFPAAAFGGKKEIMDHLAPLGEVYQAGTLSGNPVAMEAGYAALTLLEEPSFYAHLEAKARFLTDPILEVIRRKNLPVALQRVGSMFTLFFGKRKIMNFEEAKQVDLPAYRAFFHYLFERGIYFSPAQHEANFLSTAHREEHLSYVSDTICTYLDKYE